MLIKRTELLLSSKFAMKQSELRSGHAKVVALENAIKKQRLPIDEGRSTCIRSEMTVSLPFVCEDHPSQFDPNIQAIEVYCHSHEDESMGVQTYKMLYVELISKLKTASSNMSRPVRSRGDVDDSSSDEEYKTGDESEEKFPSLDSPMFKLSSPFTPDVDSRDSRRILSSRKTPTDALSLLMKADKDSKIKQESVDGTPSFVRRYFKYGIDLLKSMSPMHKTYPKLKSPSAPRTVSTSSMTSADTSGYKKYHLMNPYKHSYEILEFNGVNNNFKNNLFKK